MKETLLWAICIIELLFEKKQILPMSNRKLQKLFSQWLKQSEPYYEETMMFMQKE